MDYLNNVLAILWALNMVVVLLSVEGQIAVGFHLTYPNLCFEGKRRSYGFGKT